jgi:hypothetical protein
MPLSQSHLFPALSSDIAIKETFLSSTFIAFSLISTDKFHSDVDPCR